MPNTKIITEFLYTVDCKALICSMPVYIKLVAKSIIKKQLETAVSFCILVIFLNIKSINAIIILKYESVVKIQNIRKKASVLCIKFPNVICLINI